VRWFFARVRWPLNPSGRRDQQAGSFLLLVSGIVDGFRPLLMPHVVDAAQILLRASLRDDGCGCEYCWNVAMMLSFTVVFFLFVVVICF
jgi:hypothetical protein